MLLTVFSAFTQWLRQVGHIVNRELSYMSPSDYAIALVFCICIGFILLRGRS